jgi:hypothetical protein
MVDSLLPALGLTVLVGGGITAWLWVVQRSRIERVRGLALLSAMRWREFSRIVVDGLRARGFQPEGVEEAAERGQDSVIHLRREGQEWLLACKQGINYRITATVVGDIADAVRFHGATGGVVATPGTAESAARRLATGKIELIDGDELWPLIHPQLAPGVREELAAEARKVVARQSALAWVGALVLGLAVASVLPEPAKAPETATDVTPTAPRAAAAATGTPEAPLAAPVPATEGERRAEVARVVGTLPGIERAVWTTRSTLQIDLLDENSDPFEGICQVLDKYDDLRTSRLHLQPPAGSTRPARFLQCRTY